MPRLLKIILKEKSFDPDILEELETYRAAAVDFAFTDLGKAAATQPNGSVSV
jgi:hypothetical protein